MRKVVIDILRFWVILYSILIDGMLCLDLICVSIVWLILEICVRVFSERLCLLCRCSRLWVMCWLIRLLGLVCMLVVSFRWVMLLLVGRFIG